MKSGDVVSKVVKVVGEVMYEEKYFEILIPGSKVDQQTYRYSVVHNPLCVRVSPRATILSSP